MPFTITQFSVDPTDLSSDDVLINMFLKQQEQNTNIDIKREQAAVLSRELSCIKQENSNRFQIKQISQKLDKLERSFMRAKDYPSARTSKVQGSAINSKYQQLSSINSKINSIIRDLSPSKKAKPVIEFVKKKLITMYNQSVQQLTIKNKLSKNIQNLKEKKFDCQKEINQIVTDIQNCNNQLKQIKALGVIDSRKWKKIQEDFTRIY